MTYEDAVKALDASGRKWMVDPSYQYDEGDAFTGAFSGPSSDSVSMYVTGPTREAVTVRLASLLTWMEHGGVE